MEKIYRQKSPKILEVGRAAHTEKRTARSSKGAVRAIERTARAVGVVWAWWMP